MALLQLGTADIVKTAEDFSSLSKDEWAAHCMHMKKIEEQCQKLEFVIDEVSEQLTW
jgi:hypothetical protein